MAFLSVESSFSSSNSLRAANSAHSSIVHGRDGRRENDAMECLLDRFKPPTHLTTELSRRILFS